MGAKSAGGKLGSIPSKGNFTKGSPKGQDHIEAKKETQWIHEEAKSGILETRGKIDRKGGAE